jgi:hypothetical protein
MLAFHARLAGWLLCGALCAPAALEAQQPGAQPGPRPGAGDEAGNLEVLPGEVMLGRVRLPAAVLADGQRLPPGSYRMRLTAETATPDVPGQRAALERWVEILQGTTVKARAMASIVPADAIAQVADGTPPARGSHRVERLKEDDYVRVWFNARGQHVLLHLPIAQ